MQKSEKDKTKLEDIKPQFGNVKDELFLISFIILCAGLVFTDAYYQRFGFKYQLLNLSTIHIIYKGLTMVINSPSMLIPYLLTIALVLLEVFAIRNGFETFLIMRTPIIYFFLIANLLIIFPLAKDAGFKQAMVDIHAKTSGLPQIRTLTSNNFQIKYPSADGKKYLLFMIDGDFVTVFVPLEENQSNAYPIIKHISKNEISILETIM